MTTEIAEVSNKLYTVEEFLDLDLPDDDNDYELIGGQIVARPKSGTSAEHARIVGRLSQLLNNYLDNNPIGISYTEGTTTLGRPKGSNYVKPDICFVAAGRTPAKFRGPIPVAPDFVIEVNSPSDSNELMQDKVDAYLQAGVRLVWSIYILQKFVAVYRSDDPDPRLFNVKGELTREDVLPDFSLKISQLFQ